MVVPTLAGYCNGLLCRTRVIVFYLIRGAVSTLASYCNELLCRTRVLIISSYIPVGL